MLFIHPTGLYYSHLHGYIAYYIPVTQEVPCQESRPNRTVDIEVHTTLLRCSLFASTVCSSYIISSVQWICRTRGWYMHWPHKKERAGAASMDGFWRFLDSNGQGLWGCAAARTKSLSLCSALHQRNNSPIYLIHREPTNFVTRGRITPSM